MTTNGSNQPSPIWQPTDDEPYDEHLFARKHGLMPEQARQIIGNYGPSRAACDAAARRLLSTGKTDA
jgi:hypothetical protein